MRLWAAATLLLLGFLTEEVTARESDYCYAYEQDPYLLMGTKTAYQFVQGRTKIPPVTNCVPVQMWVLTRHGTRFPGRKAITQLHTLPKLRDQITYNHDTRGNGRLCNTDLENLRSWQLNPNLTDALANFLTAQGEQDMRLLARRLQSEFPEILRPDPQTISYQNYKFRATQTQRTQASLEAFMDGLFNSRNAVPVEPTPDNDTLLHLYKNCPGWESSLSRDHVDAESERFIAGSEYQNLLQSVSRRLGFSYKINNDSVQLMYDMCRYEKAWEVNRLSPWCAIFSSDELKVLEYLEDLDYYYYSGPGREINSKLGCPLLKDMFTHFRNLESGSYREEPKGIFYFGHTVTLQSLLAALNIGKDNTPLLASNFHQNGRRSFRTSVLGSFASNLIAVFYRCGDARSPNKVIFYLDEVPVQLEGCNVGLCDWEYLKERFGRDVDQCNLDFCYNPNSASGLVRNPLVLLVTVFLTGIAALRSL
ncbi:multiple inositol polyphosphate phosphatase 1 [Nasonia vitripennis]|uniref:Multiple inositol polyphosphate phosphatase 1 n=1 Tax=Nasonia vitripennis TaxID=7425 RepID=A0A7M7PZ31_NASVI|nr:multiple inositol polyphosphate phosphatase 1 [Nasonia vitripennis]XP_031777742.1 multiple inositol polyphosphate phosphatase 1 [Nasonia vitripennis]XP_031777743.1 multiple inositol polyphosphate phosphatase 1 [Nasonia vitripennis]XP_032452047.1 multiple inositol polyphosphate phosphatase 1 [Nasonia vitripennis]